MSGPFPEDPAAPGGPEGGERPDGADDLGSVAEEAAKLLGALAGWAGDQARSGEAWAGLAGSVAGSAAGSAADLARQLDDGLREHLATGAPECTWCPICRTVHRVRELSPEVRQHLATATTSLLAAVQGILATAVPPEGATGDGRGRAARSSPAGVERIDLDDEPWPEEEP
ncbi:hypothetical protein K8Z61_07315 [Nocardioides sp. TRM66260-LWL]|uniref:hypothetical protein n=1 Tax=Nocardioides sp. TRM66260-LWL TaxID=2874478 RepID=UPI001CC67E9B|nr:hypothetical protein [Nocardioides sp. TRM66260-LWL]MBZ5734301.1 hypothetical protein [Nocardioides sp. TRM66260-LWL]